MGELAQSGELVVEKGQKSATVRFARPYAERPTVTITGKLGTLPRSLPPQHLTRRSFRVAVNSIPFVDQTYTLRWEATGEVESPLAGIVKALAAFGALLGAYAAMVELRWLPNVLELLDGQ